eukprot:TRINITY_DN11743_c0_g1_i2.p2 TRINITY_DN11743_c0_g1~~TRINITY_DN11743_c0_g1_i2.p2  ORF type:complete len:346 (+),score=33.29 TRINITY_DN11743_c0_g1_i2:205-1242(+)
MMLVDRFLTIDKQNGNVYIISMHQQSEQMEADSWIQQIEQKIYNISKQLKEQHSMQSIYQKQANRFELKRDKNQYQDDINHCMQELHRGNTYEVCLTNKYQLKIQQQNCERIDPYYIYQDLRNQNPAPYSTYLNFGSEIPTVCCSSPERFLKLYKNGTLEARPIKGTSTRDLQNKQNDIYLANQLKNSEKNRAENLMIVDLLRNDLGRVCDIGSVHVPDLMNIESFKTVHQMVSTIRGKKRKNKTIGDCLRATFPGGSMTGAPKIRSMHIIDDLEGEARGVYSGSVGYIGFNGTFDLNIVIRTAIVWGEQVTVGAGGAIVIGSHPPEEFEEMCLKARTVLGVLQE